MAWILPTKNSDSTLYNSIFKNDISYDRSYFSKEHIDHYIEQLGGIPRKQTKKYTYGVTGTGPTASMTLEKSADELGYLDKVRWLSTKFREKGILSEKRLISMPKHGAKAMFASETMIARCFTIPRHVLPLDLNMSAMRIWVSDPDESDFSNKEFEWTGSYLFLTEIHLDNDYYHHIYSGCSALRMIANITSGQHPLNRSGEEVYGRFDKQPINSKLLQIGATMGGRYFVQSLYRIRYVTDEQWHGTSESGRRVHDVLGYPLYLRAKPYH